MAWRELSLGGYVAELVRMPDRRGGVFEALRVTVHATNFPQRAIDPELLIGELSAERVSISRDQRRLSGYFAQIPMDGAAIVVRYADSQEGVLAEPFSRVRIRPIPTGCQP
jgi:hypothetical protein